MAMNRPQDKMSSEKREVSEYVLTNTIYMNLKAHKNTVFCYLYI